MARVLFATDCSRCPGDGVVRPKSPGVDWPTACTCGARAHVSQYQLGRALDEDPKTIVRVNDLRATPVVASRVLGKLVAWMGGRAR